MYNMDGKPIEDIHHFTNLGFIKRRSHEFDSNYINLRSLFIALVRPMLERASIVWSPN